MDYDGKFFTLDDAMLYPQPSAPISLVCAGASKAGRQFTARNADFQFTICPPDPRELEKLNAQLEEESTAVGRDVKSIPLYMIVQRDTVAEAQDQVRRWRESMDLEALLNLQGAAASDVNVADESTAAALMTNEALFMSTPLIVGDAASIAEQLFALGEVHGTEGIMLNFPDYVHDIDRFGREVIPLLARMGATLETV
jgi:pyrimidine oxygenase